MVNPQVSTSCHHFMLTALAIQSMLPSTHLQNLSKSLLNLKFLALLYLYFAKHRHFLNYLIIISTRGYFRSRFLLNKEDSRRCSDEGKPQSQFYSLWLMCFNRMACLQVLQNEVKAPVHFRYRTNILVVLVFDWHIIIMGPHSHPKGWNQGTTDKSFCQIEKCTVFKAVYFSFIRFCNYYFTHMLTLPVRDVWAIRSLQSYFQ